jgi:hypothetical protein
MHHSTNPGKRVRLKLRDGTSVEGKFVENVGRNDIRLDVDGDVRTFPDRKISKFIVVKTVPFHVEQSSSPT